MKGHREKGKRPPNYTCKGIKPFPEPQQSTKALKQRQSLYILSSCAFLISCPCLQWPKATEVKVWELRRCVFRQNREGVESGCGGQIKNNLYRNFSFYSLVVLGVPLRSFLCILSFLHINSYHIL